MIKKLLIYLVLPLLIIVLLLAPRFGWRLHHTSALLLLNYTSTYRENGYTHSIYSSDNASIDISYKNRFSRDFCIIIDGGEPQYMKVYLDGASEESSTNNLLFTSNDIVWKDSSGIFYRVYIFALVLSLLGIKLYNYANKKERETKLICQALSFTLFFISLLIALRVFI